MRPADSRSSRAGGLHKIECSRQHVVGCVPMRSHLGCTVEPLQTIISPPLGNQASRPSAGELMMHGFSPSVLALMAEAWEEAGSSALC